MIEYVLLAALIAIALVVVVGTIGRPLSARYDEVTGSFPR